LNKRKMELIKNIHEELMRDAVKNDLIKVTK
jgi:hypothetical protein